MVKNYFAKIGITILAAVQLVAVGWYIHHDLAQAYVRYGPAAQLNVGDITSAMIKDATIVSADMANYNSLLLASSTIGSLTATSSVVLPTGAITSAHILNGDIINADISASAAISPQKIATTTSVYFVTDTAQTIAGVKTFSDIPVLPASDPTSDNQAARKSYVDNASLGTIYKYTAGQSLPANTAVFVATTSAAAGSVEGWAIGLDQGCASVSPNVNKCGETTTENFDRLVESIDFRLKKSGTPTDNVLLSIQTTAGDVPSDIQIASTTIAMSSLSTTYATATMTFTNPVFLAKNTKYALVLTRTGSLSNVDNYSIDIATTPSAYAGGHHKPYTTSWLDQTTHDMTFKMNYLATSADAIYIANASSALIASSTVGYTKTAVSSGAQATIITSGTWTGLSGLTTLNNVFLSTAQGLIGASAGAVNYKMGWAMSTTTALIKPEIFEQ